MMRVLVSGSTGHLGEALIRVLREQGMDVVGLDVLESARTDVVGSIVDRELVRRCVAGVDAIVHTATLHKPHVGTHRRRDFVDVNVTGTLNLLQAAVAAGVDRFVFTSTTSVMVSRAIRQEEGSAAVWLDEEAGALAPRNIYGVTKLTAEGLCRLHHVEHGLNCVVLRTGRFFPEEDDTLRELSGPNLKANE